jgi:hypothetical protein
MNVNIGQIADGREGTIQTLERMFELIEQGQVDPVVVTATRAAIGNTSFKREKRLVAKAIKGVLRNVRILEDPVRHEFIQTARITLETGRGDCDDLVILAASVLEHMGFEVNLVVGSQSSDRQYTHVWLKVFLPIAGKWLAVDPRGMLEFGWPVGRELRGLTAVEAFNFNEETRQIQAGRSSTMTGLGRGRRSRRRMGLFIEAQPVPPQFAAIGPVVLPHIQTRTFKPEIQRDFTPRMRPVRQQAGRIQRAFRGRMRGDQFPFVESRGILEGEAFATGSLTQDAAAAAAAGAGTTVLTEGGKTTVIETQTAEAAEKAAKRATLIQTLTIVALGTGIIANLSR